MKKILAIVIALMFVLIAFSIIAGPQEKNIPEKSTSVNNTIDNASKLLQVEKELQEKGIPLKYASLPAFTSHINKQNGVITPSYTSAPAPMGIGFYGTIHTC